ncbi:hypothetical protein KKC88_05255 [Patescibacteria group bacterium]|nr:hypothetical protein [Patescibacteria group bacterium]MBU1673604.1 hypothetical protein [Patescibacteria group bacterium]MBU1964034.1 hypothetical protein [Patescibacteria group bacterium]
MWWKKNIPIFFVLLLLVLIESSFFASSIFWQQNLRLVFIFLLLLLLLSSYSFIFCMKFAVLGGILLDIFSQLTFGTFTLALVISLFIVFILFRRFFTNQSYYSLVLLVASGTVIFNFILVISSIFFQTINVNAFGIEFGWPLLLSLIWQLFFNILIASVIYRIIKSFSPSYA